MLLSCCLKQFYTAWRRPSGGGRRELGEQQKGFVKSEKKTETILNQISSNNRKRGVKGRNSVDTHTVLFLMIVQNWLRNWKLLCWNLNFNIRSQQKYSQQGSNGCDLKFP